MKLFSMLPLHKTIAPRQVISNTWEDRTIILEENVNLFCWKRQENKNIITYLNKCLSLKQEPILFSTNKRELAAKLSKARNSWDNDHDLLADDFWIDVHHLISDFLTFSDNDLCQVHLRIIEDNACTKFHTDGYALRLFTTYIGRGTEWLPEEATNRQNLGKSNDLIVKDISQIQQMKPFEVGILKGEDPDRKNHTKGIVHRSPEIERIEEKRVILRIDI